MKLTTRQQRVLAALLRRPCSREEVDRIAGASNGPEVIAQLRRRGIAIQCKLVERTDCDGKPCRPGIYSLTDADRAKIAAALK